MGYSDALEALIQTTKSWQSPVAGDWAVRVRQAWLDAMDKAPSVSGTRASILHELEAAEPYFVSADICALLDAAWPSCQGAVLDPDLLPTQTGWVWFERVMPLRLPGLDPHGRPWPPVQAVSWETIAISAEEAPEPKALNAVSMTFWEPWERSYGEPMAPRFVASLPVFLGEVFQDSVSLVGAGRDFMQRGLTLMAAFWLFCRQTLLTTHEERVPRASRRRLAVADPSRADLVRVVLLRRTQHDPSHAEGQSRDVAWHVRWLVRGHWRNQYHPSDGTRRPRWIAPYVKGPADKPLKRPSIQLFSVSR